MVDGRPENQTKMLPWIIGGTALTGLASLGGLAMMARKRPGSLLRPAGHTPSPAPIDVKDLLKSLAREEEGYASLGRGVQDLQASGAARRAELGDLERRVDHLLDIVVSGKARSFDLPGAQKDLDSHAAFLKTIEGGGQATPPRTGHLDLIKEAWITGSRRLW